MLRACLGCLSFVSCDMPTMFQDVHSMRCLMWQENMVLMSKSVQGAMRMVRAASSGDELDVCPAKLAGTEVTSSSSSCQSLPIDTDVVQPRMVRVNRSPCRTTYHNRQ